VTDTYIVATDTTETGHDQVPQPTAYMITYVRYRVSSQARK